MKGFHCATLVLISLVSLVSSSSDTCSYSVQRSCVAPGAQDVRSNILSSINSIKLSEISKKKNELGLKAYGSNKDDDDDIYTKALCPCACDRCPKPMRAQSEGGYGETDDEVDSNKCLCLCGTCGRKNSNKNKLPSVVPLDCNLKCEVIADTKPHHGGHKPPPRLTKPPSSYAETSFTPGTPSPPPPPPPTDSTLSPGSSVPPPPPPAEVYPKDEDEDGDDIEEGDDEIEDEEENKK